MHDSLQYRTVEWQKPASVPTRSSLRNASVANFLQLVRADLAAAEFGDAVTEREDSVDAFGEHLTYKVVHRLDGRLRNDDRVAIAQPRYCRLVSGHGQGLHHAGQRKW